MKSLYLYLVLSVCCIAGTAICTLLGHQTLCVALAVAAIVFLCMLYGAVIKPFRALRSGMDLLRSQDFASRLRKVGQRDTDEVVEVFNRMMSTMKAERLKVEEQQAFLEKLVAVSPMGIAICDFDGEITSSNDAFRKLGGPELENILKSFADGEERVLRIGGGGKVLKCTRLHFMDRGFRRSFFLVEMLTDEIILAEKSLFNKIVRTMGHEVNNTLGGIMSLLETMEDIHEGDEVVVAALQSGKTSARALSEFVKSYSDVVKLPEAQLDDLNLGEFLRGSAPFLAAICPPEIELRLDIDKAGTVKGDEMLLQRVLVNAVKNSVESLAGCKEGVIVLRSVGNTLEVEDNGPGISAENATRVFSPFFSTKNADRGLGLMLISDVLRKHGADYGLSTGADGLTRLHIEF
ncbi:MAG: PAS domain-containing sensor histidine kinase [Muribaculaceae bacterium]|nr:PAS domain-containing sensor histidine kinase [Muribaculaceae bacterium]